MHRHVNSSSAQRHEKRRQEHRCRKGLDTMEAVYSTEEMYDKDDCCRQADEDEDRPEEAVDDERYRGSGP